MERKKNSNVTVGSLKWKGSRRIGSPLPDVKPHQQGEASKDKRKLGAGEGLKGGIGEKDIRYKLIAYFRGKSLVGSDGEQSSKENPRNNPPSRKFKN